MGQIKVTATGAANGPTLKIEYRDCWPVKNEAHYGNEFIINLDSSILIDPPRRKPIPAAPAGNPPEKA